MSNVQLSVAETYADIFPVRATPDGRSAIVSVMRGCNNTCSCCVVPFSRWRKRSRYVDTILAQRLRVSAPARAERQHDFFSGFCGETEEEHQDTMSLVTVVQDDQAFGFVYSSARRRTPTAP